MSQPIPPASPKRAALALFAVLFWSISATAPATEVGIFAEKPVLSADDSTQNISISASSDERVAVDLHLVLISPGGTISAWPDWNTVLRPALSLTIPADFDFPATIAFDAADFPGGLEPGPWVAAIGVAEPGTLNFIDIALARFQVVDDDGGSGNDTRFGALSLSRTQSSFGIDVAAEGVFFELNGGLDELETAYLGDTPGIGKCTLYEVPLDLSAIPDIDVDFLDAGGALSLFRDGTPALTLPKDADAESFGAILYSADAAPRDYVGNSNYRFQGPGGADIGPFRVPIQSPPALNLTSPSVASTLVQPTTEKLDIAWSGSNVGGEVDVSLVASTLSKVVTIQCRFEDRGTGTVPANLLRQMKNILEADQDDPALPPIPGFDDIELPPGFEFPGLPLQATLSVSRTTTAFLETSGGNLDIGIATISSGADVSVTLQ